MIRGLIINRWSGSGIVLQGPNADSVVGNWIGTGSDGASPAGNGNGILITSSQHLIGGTTAADCNIISGNAVGVNIRSSSARGNVVIGNYIGTDVTGTLDVGNTDTGVYVLGAGEQHRVAGCERRELDLGKQPGRGRARWRGDRQLGQGNAIGTNVSRTGALPNGIGISIGPEAGASTNFIGGTAAGSGNLVAFNATAGVQVWQGSSDNAILGNSIRDNGALGIDLIGNGITANDAGDGDEGPNNLQNFPVLTGSSAACRERSTASPYHLPDRVLRQRRVRRLRQRRGCDAPRAHDGHDQRHW